MSINSNADGAGCRGLVTAVASPRRFRERSRPEVSVDIARVEMLRGEVKLADGAGKYAVRERRDLKWLEAEHEHARLWGARRRSPEHRFWADRIGVLARGLALVPIAEGGQYLARPGATRLRVTLTRNGRKLLARDKPVRLTATSAFTPARGHAITYERTSHPQPLANGSLNQIPSAPAPG